jgi:site-specific recombinase
MMGFKNLPLSFFVSIFVAIVGMIFAENKIKERADKIQCEWCRVIDKITFN